MEQLERYCRRENLIVKGEIPETANENVKDLVLENVLNVTRRERGWTHRDISTCRKLGKANPEDRTPARPRAIVVRFACIDDKLLVF
jgi:hypothetical protein